MIYIKVNDALYPAMVSGKEADRDWDGRRSKSITMNGDYATVNDLFPDGVAWSIVCEENAPVMDEEGNYVLNKNGEQTYETRQVEDDNSDFNMRGSITVHADGTCTVKMGHKTEVEELRELTDELLLEVLGV